jgi:hypothetical protein
MKRILVEKDDNFLIHKKMDEHDIDEVIKEIVETKKKITIKGPTVVKTQEEIEKEGEKILASILKIINDSKIRFYPIYGYLDGSKKSRRITALNIDDIRTIELEIEKKGAVTKIMIVVIMKNSDEYRQHYHSLEDVKEAFDFLN